MATQRADLFRKLVNERLVVSVILLNAAVLFVRAFEWGDRHPALFTIDYVCTVYFVFEMLVKIGLNGFRSYWKDGWNKFDFIVVVASSPHLLAPFLPVDDFAVLLILRTCRLARVLRVMRFIPDRDRLWSGMSRALRASVGVLVALVIYNFILGLGGSYLFRESPYFDNPLIAMYSMFQVFTVEGWHEIPESIAATSGPGWAAFARVYFVFAVLTGGLLGLSLANAVFVDEMMIDNNDELLGKVDRLQQQLDEAREENRLQNERLEAALAALDLKLTPDLEPPPDARAPRSPPSAE